MYNYEELSQYSKEELIKLIEAYTKNWLALDGLWFQSVEKEEGLDRAMHYDVEAWQVYTAIEARRIKEFLGLDEHPGLEGLAKAFRLRFCASFNEDSIEIKDNKLYYRVLKCRVQGTRERKGMPLHPCKMVGTVEFGNFGKAIDSRISCECVSCYPEITDKTCCCMWIFTLNE